jgi:Flp pilus assembly protein TadD
MIGERRIKQTVLALTLVAVVVLGSTVPGPFAQETVDFRPELCFGVGYHYYERGDWEQARIHLGQALKLRPDFPEVHNYLGITLYRLNELPEAVRHIHEAHRLDPEFIDAKNSLETIAEEAAFCRKQAWDLIVSQQSTENDLEKAVLVARRALVLAGWEDKCSLAVLAVSLTRSGELEQAQRVLAKIGPHDDRLSCAKMLPRLPEALAALEANRPWPFSEVE